MHFKGIVFDLDGVITQTAAVHFRAWKQTFEDYLNKVKPGSKEFTHDDDYVPYVDGKPRYEGVKSFLNSRGIELPFGDPSDSADQETYCGIGNRKNVFYKEIIKKEGVQIYQPTIDFVKEAKEAGIHVGVASSSKNCRFVLETINLIGLFETVVDGNVSKEFHLRGKPQPDIFTKCTEIMGVTPDESVVVEDAVSGVQAGRNGNFGLVIGITHLDDKHILLANGADMVVEDLSPVSLESIENWFSKGLPDDNWHLSYYDYNPDEERLREALTTTGNGYYGSRGSFESNTINDDLYYPGNYIAGLFNKIPSEVHGKTIYNNDFVNCPNWFMVRVLIGEDKEPVDLEKGEILDYEHKLNMKEATVRRKIRFKDSKGRITSIQTERFADIINPHLGVLKYSITPENYFDMVTIESCIDGSVINYGVPRYRKLNSKHLEVLNKKEDKGLISLNAKTNASHYNIYVNARNEIYRNNEKIDTKRTIDTTSETITESFSINACEAETYELEKVIGVYTSKDMGIRKPEEACNKDVRKAGRFSAIHNKHSKRWVKIWDAIDMQIEGDRFTQKVSRLHMYHLMITASEHNKKIDFGLPARGLHGEAYRGHIFWDELYVLPFYYKHFPEVAKALLKYRYRRLDGARANARESGYKGAMYPWQTADGADEETQILHYNPVSDSWGPDLSRRQRHVSIAIAYNMINYYHYTLDQRFLNEFGGEVIIEICRFWTSIANYDPADKRYHIEGVMGPDEFHEKYPGKPDEEAGIKDNAYTNIMVSWLLKKTIGLLEVIPKSIQKKLNLTSDELGTWQQIAKNLNVSISKEGIIEQYKGYFDLKELDWDHYKQKYGNIRRMDRILKSEDDSPDHYKVSKQADTLMTFYLLSPEEVKDELNYMGYEIDDEMDLLRKNYEYYIQRTSHGSTLSYVVHSFILKYLETDERVTWDWFYNALKSDIYDTQGGTTLEGIHCGVMAGTLDIMTENFAGIMLGDHIEIAPNLPGHWKSFSCKIKFRGEIFKFTITHEIIDIENIDDHPTELFVVVNGEKYMLKGQKRVNIPYKITYNQ